MAAASPSTPSFLLEAIAGTLDMPHERASALAELVTARYSEPQRYYHSLRHISHLCTLLLQHQHAINDPSTVLAAILFHDIIYDPRSSSNEDDSARMWLETCEMYPGLRRSKEAVREYILATKSHDMPANGVDSDLYLFLDMDLAILGAPREEYGEYAVNIRREYSHVDVETYCQAREKFMRDMLDRRLFKSASFFETYEARAQENIRWECDILASRRLVLRPDYLTCTSTRTLVPFTPSSQFEFTIGCTAKRDARNLEVVFGLSGKLDEIAIDYEFGESTCMWEHTCFEVFLSIPNEAKYWELNVSGFGHWNILKFTNYHERAHFDAECLRTSVRIAETDSNNRKIAICLPLLQLFVEDELAGDLLLNLAAVVESRAGVLSYWSHYHAGSHPDFHHRDSFSVII